MEMMENMTMKSPGGGGQGMCTGPGPASVHLLCLLGGHSPGQGGARDTSWTREPLPAATAELWSELGGLEEQTRAGHGEHAAQDSVDSSHKPSEALR